MCHLSLVLGTGACDCILGSYEAVGVVLCKIWDLLLVDMDMMFHHDLPSP